MTANQAIRPDRSASVAASAGTGKTYLLVSRIIRLLLEDARPDAIVAITFTRKAAAEMQSRLLDRLSDLVTVDDQQLDDKLTALEISLSEKIRRRARHLYEKLLRSERSVRFFTFHAFCQEILRRFPLEADVPPGFELIEDTGLLAQEAWDALASEATGNPDGDLARALDTLLDYCEGLGNTSQAAAAFLAHRSDWWAYTSDTDAPVAWAVERLALQLGVSPSANPRGDFFNDANIRALWQFGALLDKHPNATNRKHAVALHRALDSGLPVEQRFDYAASVFLKKDGEPFQRKPSGPQSEKMGTDGEVQFLALHAQLSSRLQRCMDDIKKLDALNANHAWYLAGNRYVEHYQRLKREQRLLDFTDLEWKAWQLLNVADNAHWVQYKLDQRIDHLLIDEFQDTNPTQWRLIRPLFEDLAAGGGDRQRSIFLVGDVKQSIYRFRRADPRMFDSAQNWLSDKLDAHRETLTMSYRSSPAIIEFINRLFSSGGLHEALPDFQRHDTHRRTLWGKVEILPLVTVEASEPPAMAFRRPLHQPRLVIEDQRFYMEGRLIASRIRELIDKPVILGGANDARPAEYADIVILVRNRTHVDAYERALREAGIPYLGESRGTLMECLEIQDMINLLRSLIAPYDDLVLASVLRSPLFGCTDDDLMELALSNTSIPEEEKPGLWFNRLRRVAAEKPEGSPLRRACKYLAEWSVLANQLPVHDLIDRIYKEGNVLAHYDAAFPPHLRSRVYANLTRFIELALEVDSGRYPSLSHFLDRLQRLRTHGGDAPDEAPVISPEGNVRIMTIHGAKGLEAPVIFLADASNTGRLNSAYSALIDWIPARESPDYMLLAGRKDRLDSYSLQCLCAQQQEQRREETNLLYVALTRARQLLFISACASRKKTGDDWYQQIAAALAPDDPSSIATGWIDEKGREPPYTAPPRPAISPRQPIPVELSRPLSDITSARDIAPSFTVDHDAASGAGGMNARIRGTAIHRLLQWASEHPENDAAVLPEQLTNELAPAAEANELKEWWQETRDVMCTPSLQYLFDDCQYLAVYNEVPIQYLMNKQLVHGVIDRLVVTDKNVIIIDYKTHRDAAIADLPRLAQPYTEQMRLYQEGVERLWPDKPVKSVLLFTACATGYEL